MQTVQNNDHADVRLQLTTTLIGLPYDAFVRCAADILTHYGYGNIQPMGRKDRIGRNQHGGGSGYEISMTVSGGALRRTAIAQVRQYAPSQPIYQRTVDELRGACLRVGAAEGVLITVGPISAAVNKELLPYSPVVPLRLIDGEELAQKMVQVGIGIRTTAQGEKVFDGAYFQRLVRESAPQRHPKRTAVVVREQIPLLPTHRRNGQILVQLTLSHVPGANAGESHRERNAAR